VYVGNSKLDVEQAITGGKEFRGNKNIYTFTNALPKGETVYWRVDVIRNDELIKGDVWMFTVEN